DLTAMWWCVPPALPAAPFGPIASRHCLNLFSMYYGIHAALPVMVKQGAGTILSTTSGAGLGAVPGLAAYGAAKAGMISLTRSIAAEFGRHGIRANVISPGSIDTAPFRRWLDSLPGGD